jgi:hypothetical protein
VEKDVLPVAGKKRTGITSKVLRCSSWNQGNARILFREVIHSHVGQHIPKHAQSKTYISEFKEATPKFLGYHHLL